MSLTQIIRISRLDSATIPAAVRLTAELAIREIILEHEAPKAARVSAKVWDKIRPELSEIFHFSAGKITLAKDSGLNEFDLLLLRTESAAPAKKEGKYPTDPRILDMIELGIEPDEATKLARYIVKTYGEPNFVRGIAGLKEKNPPPLDPKNYLMGVVKSGLSAGPNGLIVAGLRPRRVKRTVRIINPEAAKTEFLGWEAPSSIENGAARFPAPIRRKIYRMRTGKLEFVTPKETELVPSVEQDPGLIIED